MTSNLPQTPPICRIAFHIALVKKPQFPACHKDERFEEMQKSLATSNRLSLPITKPLALRKSFLPSDKSIECCTQAAKFFTTKARAKACAVSTLGKLVTTTKSLLELAEVLAEEFSDILYL
jgi:hypothetical protein